MKENEGSLANAATALLWSPCLCWRTVSSL